MDIKQLNAFIHENLIHRKNLTPYGLLEDVSKQMTFGIKIPDRRFLRISQSMTIDQVKKIALDFLKSIDEELYQKAKSIINGKTDFEFNIYYKDEISPKQMDVKRKDGMPKYTSFGCLHTTNGKKGIYIPCERNIRDVYLLVHEISHSFDYCNPDTPTRNLLGEITPKIFEMLLQQYLLEKNLISREDAIAIEKNDIVSHYDDGVETYAKLTLMRIKEKRGSDGEITEEDIMRIQEKYHISRETVEYILNRMMGKRNYTEVDFRARYMVAQLIYPYVMEQHYRHPEKTVEMLKEYFNAVKSNDFYGALKSLNIEESPESIKLLIDCVNRRIERVFKTRLFDEHENAKNLKRRKPFFGSDGEENPGGEEPGSN